MLFMHHKLILGRHLQEVRCMFHLKYYRMKKQQHLQIYGHWVVYYSSYMLEYLHLEDKHNFFFFRILFQEDSTLIFLMHMENTRNSNNLISNQMIMKRIINPFHKYKHNIKNIIIKMHIQLITKIKNLNHFHQYHQVNQKKNKIGNAQKGIQKQRKILEKQI